MWDDIRVGLRSSLRNPVFTILATAQSLFDDVTTRDEPFYGFFNTHQLTEYWRHWNDSKKI